jgi:ribosomal-protein-alanine N-acetyltransferase
MSCLLPCGGLGGVIPASVPGRRAEQSTAPDRLQRPLLRRSRFRQQVSAGVRCEEKSQMKERPTLETDRLILRPFTLTDAPDVQRLAGERDVASTTRNIPHPYADGMAEQWIRTHQEQFEHGAVVNFAIVLRADNMLIGAIGLRINPQDGNAELGYWIGKPYWNHGYCTEAAHAVVGYGFEVLGLHRIHASYLTRNPASGRVMQKLGMTSEGCLRQHVNKWEVFENLALYGILRSEYVSHKPRKGRQ